MSLPLDHIVIAVHDLERTIADYAALGFTVRPGGQHPGRPTHNALVVFGDGSYFELIAWRESAPYDRWWQQLQSHGEGLVDFALLPSDTTEVTDAARARGLDYEPTHEGGRLRPDGVQLRWRNARPRSRDLPFLCGDLTPRPFRVPEGDARVHANGVQGVASVSVVVHDLDSSLQRYQALFGESLSSGPVQATADGTARQARVVLGASTLVLTQPLQATSALGQRLASQGEGPYALELIAPAQAQPPALAPSATHGVHIDWAAAPASRSASAPALESAGAL